MTVPKPPDGEPDYRFTLANERTLLAYLRTALALDAAGLAAVQFLTDIGSHLFRTVIGVLLALTGSAAAGGGYLRWRSVQRAMVQARPLPSASIALLVAGVVAVASIVSAVVLIFR